MEMLKFECKNCGYSQGVSEKYASKTVRCPKCQSFVKIGNEPIKPWLDGGLVKFYCSACGKKLAAKAENYGRKLQCIKCKKEQIIPTLPENIAPEEREPDATSVLKVDRGQSRQDSESGGMGDLLSMEANAEVLERPEPQYLHANEAAAKNTADRSDVKSDEQNWLKKPVTIIGGLICIIIMFFIFETISNALKGNLTTKRKENIRIHECGDYGGANADAMDFIRDIRRKDFFGKSFFGLRENLSTTLKLISDKELLKLSEYPVDVNSIILDTENSFIKKLNENDTAYFMQYSFGPGKKDNVIVYVISRKGFKSKIHGFRYNFRGYKPASYATEEGNEVYAMVMIENFSGPFIWVLKYKVPIIIFVSLFSVFYSICMVSVYMKAGESGINAIIPIYNLYVLAQIGDKPGWMGLVVVFSSLIPIVGPIVAMVFMFIISMGVAKAFEKGIVFGFGLFLLPLIFYPILAFSGPAYD
jgi:hypothetical protein